MPDKELVDPAVALLSTAIGMIMEDHAADAVCTLPGGSGQWRDRLQQLEEAGCDIAALARAGAVLLRRREA